MGLRMPTYGKTPWLHCRKKYNFTLDLFAKRQVMPSPILVIDVESPD
jgi:hypothetical protein